jgi:orotidine-5'-phosphate decarboxylase
MKKEKGQLAVALDMDSLGKARDMIETLGDMVNVYKVGSQLFTACGPAGGRFIEAQGKKGFLDLKFHDIPNTVARSVESAVRLSVALERSMDHKNRVEPKNLGLLMFTVHTSGGLEMLQAAVEANQKAAESIKIPKPKVLGVTVLTSEQKRDNILALVLERALVAHKAGCDGVVASCEEARYLRKEFGQDLVIVTPGIRPQGSDVQDQKRVATPQQAIQSGSDYLVVGRPIVAASDPYQAAKSILEEMNAA